MRWESLKACRKVEQMDCWKERMRVKRMDSRLARQKVRSLDQ